MPISRFGVLCCLRAAEEIVVSMEPPGHALVLAEGDQQQLHDQVRALSKLRHFAISAPGGRKATVLIHEVVRFLALSEEGQCE